MVTPSDYLARFIVRARELHGDRYDYSQFVWTGAREKGVIVCQIAGHGPFEKTPEHHAQRGQGCPKCTNAKKSAKSVIKHMVPDGENKTEYQIMSELGRTWIWDCGSLKYEWVRSL